MKTVRRRLINTIGLLIVVCVTTGAGSALACALDNVPSASVNGRIAYLNPVLPHTNAQLKSWTVFLFPGSYTAGVALHLAEDRKQVAKSLIPAAMIRAPRWVLNDGSVAYGWQIAHRFVRPGHYRIVVSAYLASTKLWYDFDQITLVVSAAHTLK